MNQEAVERRYPEATAAWVDALGSDAVLLEPGALASYHRNTGAYTRAIPLVLRPGSTRDVLALVAIANQYRVPLYPISCGHNWGFGSKLPVQSDNVIVDLGRMNRIRNFDSVHGFAVVEPGVTQGDLHDHLTEAGGHFFFNVVGAGRRVSVLGNALERGIGYFASRADDLSNLEVVSGGGEMIRTGMGRFEGAQSADLYKYGVGPSLDGLFAQSNFGIVTAATIQLYRRPPIQAGVVIKIEDGARLPAVIDALRGIRQDGIIASVIHIGDRGRSTSTLGPGLFDDLRSAYPADTAAATRRRVHELLDRAGFTEWSAVASIGGSAASLRVKKREISRRLVGLARVSFIDERIFRLGHRLSRWRVPAAVRDRLRILSAIEPLHRLTSGVPTDQPLKSAFWDDETRASFQDAVDPDESNFGILYCNPVVPFTGEAVEVFIRLVEQMFARHGFTPSITLNAVTPGALAAITSVAFDRRKQSEVARAHQLVSELFEEFVRVGLIPYRSNVAEMARFSGDGSPYGGMLVALKDVFDPNRILSPGRYCPTAGTFRLTSDVRTQSTPSDVPGVPANLESGAA